MSELVTDHVKHVLSVVRSRLHPEAPGGLNRQGCHNRIARSWARCLNEYHLEPDQLAEPEIVSRVQLLERQEKVSDVQRVAKIEMANLYQQLAGSGYAIMLTDADGVLLNYFGDPSFTHAASKSGLTEGAIWSERTQGTNGMGTCLIEKMPITVHQEEHYLARNIGLSCAAAPIYNHSGDIVAVLDASGESRLAQQHTLALVNMSVQMIENRVFQHHFRDSYIVRFHNRPEFVGTLSEGAIALSGSGTVLGATRCALFQLGMRDPSEILGHPITQLFNVTFSGLVDSSVKKAFHPVPVFEVNSGARFFTVIYPPEPAVRLNRSVTTKPAEHCTARNASAIEHGQCALDKLLFGDPRMAHNVEAAKRVLERNVAIMLCGETGTGKELFAKAAHASGSRAHKPFVAINCASIPETLIESELFGYKSGAFTGASKDGQRGKIFQANGGTLFLDEIGDMPIALQARLLRVLEEREVTPLGSETPVTLDIRLICATHCDLHKKIDAGEFREDLFYRLQGLTITMPPLRERTDRGALIQHLLRAESDEGHQIELDSGLLQVLEQYRWPGNVRQLRHLLRTMIALRDTDLLTTSDLPEELLPGAAQIAAAAPAQTDHLNALENAEKDALILELKRHSWNITTLAKQLKVSRNTLYRKVHRLNIKNPDKSLQF
jgi:transcriptional regulator of acetoin/glycerol metabolism